MPEIVQFKASNETKVRLLALLDEVRAKAEAGQVNGIAIVTAERQDDGPRFQIAYEVEGTYAIIVAGVSAIQFDLHWVRYKELEEFVAENGGPPSDEGA